MMKHSIFSIAEKFYIDNKINGNRWALNIIRVNI